MCEALAKWLTLLVSSKAKRVARFEARLSRELKTADVMWFASKGTRLRQLATEGLSETGGRFGTITWLRPLALYSRESAPRVSRPAGRVSRASRESFQFAVSRSKVKHETRSVTAVRLRENDRDDI